MKPKVITTERDYQAALAHVETLMDKASPDEAELELWSLLVEKYEDEHFPIAAPDPIEAIRFRMEQDLRDYEANPTAGSPWPEVKARITRKS